MGFNRGEVSVKALNIGEVGRKGAKSIMGWLVMRGTITAHSHLDGRVKVVPGDSLHPTMAGTGGHTGRSTGHDKKDKMYVHLSTYGKNRILK